jgi:glycosyltransferase involved in cell wall biosynthesis
MTDILCFSTTDWDETWGSRQQVMLRFVQRGHRVLFIERQVGPENLMRDPALRQRKQAAWRQPRLVKLQANLWRWQPPLMLPGRYYSQTLNRFGQGWLAGCVKPILQRLDFEKPILWLYPPQSSPLLWKFSEQLSVYHCIERFSGEQRGLKRRVMEAQEQDLLRKVGMVFVHSASLRQLYTPLTRRPPIINHSAADVAHFQSTLQVHPLIDAIPHPRLVVMGTLDGRIDIQLLEAVALWREDWHLVLIGPIHPERANFTSLLRRSNVHALGKQSYQDLPALLNGADVCLIPYKLTGMTRFINPLKAYEYMAVGKPIVSVKMPALENIAEWIYFPRQERNIESDNIKLPPDDSFIDAIRQALRDDTPELQAQRRRVALEHDWDWRVDQMIQAIVDCGFLKKF